MAVRMVVEMCHPTRPAPEEQRTPPDTDSGPASLPVPLAVAVPMASAVEPVVLVAATAEMAILEDLEAPMVA